MYHIPIYKEDSGLFEKIILFPHDIHDNNVAENVCYARLDIFALIDYDTAINIDVAHNVHKLVVKYTY